MPENYEPSPKVRRMAEGIAKAEGWDAAGDPLPRRIHNPGDLEIGDRGFGVQAGKTCFPDDDTGWAWLFGEVSLMLASMQTRHRSKVYTLDETWIQVATHWTGNDNAPAWANIVSEYCGVPVESTLNDYMEAA